MKQVFEAILCDRIYKKEKLLKLNKKTNNTTHFEIGRIENIFASHIKSIPS